MSFLAPIFLVGTLAVALPVVFHLIRRSTKDKLPFSSLLFLSPTPPRLTRRSRLEHLLLLALRCVIICLVAFAFARPFFKSVTPAAPAGTGKRMLILLDTSASMRRADLWAQATRRAIEVASRAGAADSLAITSFDRQSRTVVSFEEWAGTSSSERMALVQAKLKSVSPGWFSTSLGQALVTAAESVSDRGTNLSAPAEIVVISDLQEGSKLEPVQGFEWPKGLQVSFQTLKLPSRSNASLQLVRASETETRGDQPLRVRVSNSSDSRKDQFKLSWQRGTSPGPVGPSLDVYVPAGQSRVFSMPDLGTNQPKADRVVLTGDDDDFDNTLFVVHPEPKLVEVAFVGKEAEENPKQQLYFLKRAFQETQRQAVHVTVYSPETLVPLSDQLSLIVGAGPLGATGARQLSEQVRQGKVMLYTMLEDQAAADLGQLLNIAEPNVREASRTTYTVLAAIDFQHPLLAPFADPRFSDFSKIHFWRHRTLDASTLPKARVLASFDGGDPALVEIPAGKGRLYVLTSGWQPEDSQLALSTKFVPLLYSFLEQGGAPSPVELTYQVGDPLPLGLSPEGSVAVRTPAGALVPIATGDARFADTLTPGIYVVEAAQERHTFAVNLDPVESRTTPLKPDAFEALGAPMAGGQLAAAAEMRRQAKLRNAELEGRQKIWRWLILTTLIVVVVETLLAARASRQAHRAHRGELEVNYGT